ncbi:hypothetical protein [Chromobacterium rhizoryzae]|uniref:hypothetical protein n=1 Tax=Chromobacterium rhizoryzae TaxID=1778675 RepID=UPI0013C36CDF|nr:hypothetical protein [Chromobacterium rhizoryzae]
MALPLAAGRQGGFRQDRANIRGLAFDTAALTCGGAQITHTALFIIHPKRMSNGFFTSIYRAFKLITQSMFIAPPPAAASLGVSVAGQVWLAKKCHRKIVHIETFSQQNI